MSSSGPLLILEGSMDPHWAWGFCSKWFFRDFSPSENKGIMFRKLPFHQDVSCGFSWKLSQNMQLIWHFSLTCLGVNNVYHTNIFFLFLWVTITEEKSVTDWQLCVIDRWGTRGLISTSLTFAVSEVAYAQNIVDILVVVLFNVWSLFWSVLELHCNLF